MQRILLAAAALGLIAASAHAAPAARTLTVNTRVVYSDLNLSTEAGAKVMLARIKSAAEAGCGGTPFAQVHSLTAFDQFNACRDQAVKSAVAGLREPLVSRLAAGRPALSAPNYAAAR